VERTLLIYCKLGVKFEDFKHGSKGMNGLWDVLAGRRPAEDGTDCGSGMK